MSDSEAKKSEEVIETNETAAAAKGKSPVTQLLDKLKTLKAVSESIPGIILKMSPDDFAELQEALKEPVKSKTEPNLSSKQKLLISKISTSDSDVVNALLSIIDLNNKK